MSLRRRRRIGDARHALRRAQVVLDDLGAAGLGGPARAELAATGAPVTTAAEPAWRVLSPQELQIARLAAEGLSNREIGSRLYLSHRTVGSHLYRIFPKLGVTSRGQLHQVLGPPVGLSEPGVALGGVLGHDLDEVVQLLAETDEGLGREQRLAAHPVLGPRGRRLERPPRVGQGDDHERAGPRAPATQQQPGRLEPVEHRGDAARRQPEPVGEVARR